MRLLQALFIPFTLFFNIGRPISGIFCAVLQLSVIGWIPASLWASAAYGKYKSDLYHVYEQITQGMTYNDVKLLIGYSHNNGLHEHGKNQKYQWKADYDETSSSLLGVGFQNSRVISKNVYSTKSGHHSKQY
jgi:hypothetical protein